MEQGQKLRISDAREILRLVTRLHNLAGEGRAWKEHLLSGLCQVMGAGLGVWALLGNEEGRWRVGSMADVGVGSGRQREVLRRYLENDPMRAMLQKKRRGATLTCLAKEVVAERAWTAKETDQRRRDAGIDDCIYSLRFLPGEEMAAAICLYGERGRPRFGPREAMLLHLVHTELELLYEREGIGEGPRLPPGQLTTRERQTLEHLLAGLSEKQVAAKMGLSRHTVHVYVQQLYRHFNVNSRAELLAQFVRD